MSHSDQNNPKTCRTCAHRTEGKCMASGYYTEVERKFPTVCGKDFSAWIKRESLLQRFKNWLYTA